MLRLTLRTLLAYLDDTLPAADAKVIGQKLSESPQAQELVAQINRVTRKRGLSTPPAGPDGGPGDPNTVAAYLTDSLPVDRVAEFEQSALNSDVLLADVAACHQILTLVLSEQMRVPPSAYRRMYTLVKGPASNPKRPPGNVLPVGGAIPTDRPADAADADAQLLLGMTPYSRSQPLSVRATRWATAALLAVGFVVAAWLAWPKGGTDLVMVTPNTAGTPPTTAATPPTTPKPADQPPADPAEPKPKPVDDGGEVKPVPVEPPVPVLVPDVDLPNRERLAVAKFDSPDGRVLLARKDGTDQWAPAARNDTVFSTDKLLAPPGCTARLAFETGAVAELWGNVFPDLLPLPILDAAVTTYPPADGFDADFTLHAGRVYLSAGQAASAKMRVRVRDDIWDLTLPDQTSEVAVQLVNAPTPGRVAEPPTASLLVYVAKGTASVKVGTKTFEAVPAGRAVAWDSKTGLPTGPVEAKSSDFVRSPVYPNAKAAQPMLLALEEFATRVKEAKTVPAALAEMRIEPNAPPTPDYYAGCRLSVLTSAATGDVSVIADALNDATRQDIRATAVYALQHMLACQPELEKAFRAVAGPKLRLSDESLTQLLRVLRGLTEAERTDRTTLTNLATLLDAPEVAQREAALYILLTEVDPASQARPGLAFDTAGTEPVRQAAVAEWQKRIAEITGGGK